jgi:hypothetical protein
MSRLGKKIEDLMSAISFAEEGEFEAAKQMLKEEKRVLLAIRDEEVDKKSLKYAMNTCKRIKANLDILYISPSDSKIDTEDTRLIQLHAELKNEGICYRLIRKIGCLKQWILDYTNSERDVFLLLLNQLMVWILTAEAKNFLLHGRTLDVL